MDINDEQIGARLQAIRGPVLSQAGIAQAMKERGHDKWSQATVWSVEAGKRPLRLSEAVSLASILHADVGDLVQSTEAGAVIGALRQAIAEVDKIASDLSFAVIDFEDARTALRLVLQDIDTDQVSSWPESELGRLTTLVEEAGKRMNWEIEDLVELADRNDDWSERLLYAEPEGEDDGVDQEA